MPATFIAIDIETSGLYPVPGSKIFCIAVNTGGAIQVHTDILKLKPVLEDKNVIKIIHNAAFDCFWLKMLYGITVTNIWDTNLMERIILGDNLPRNQGKITEEQRIELSASLLYTLKRYGLADLKNKDMGAAFATRNKLSPLSQAEIEYAKNDVRFLLHLQAMQERRLVKLDLMRVANLENSIVELVVSMRARGIIINQQKWKNITEQNQAMYSELLKRLPATVANWNSHQQVKKYFADHGIPILSLTDVTPDFVEQYNDPVLHRYVEMKKYATAISKYGMNFLLDKDGNTVIDYDGRVRAEFEQILNTGRFSCSRPPLHGLPREGEQRSAIEAKSGYTFVSGDFGGQEIGIMSAASGEELWIKALLRGEDPLSLMASMLFIDWSKSKERGCVFPKKCKCTAHRKLRQDAKEITYGIAYGAYPLSISVKIKRTKKETNRLFEKHKRAAPKLNRWLNTNAKESVKTRISYSADIYKRRRTIRDPEDWMVRNVGFNNPVQSCAANMLKLAMISLGRLMPNIVFTWHDALILEIKKSAAKKAAKELKIIMEKAADYCTGVPGLIKVEPKITPNLAG